MDLKIVIRQLLDKGLSREQVISNLQELGVSDAEKLFDEAVAQQKPAVAPAPKPQLQETQAPQSRGLFKQMEEPAEKPYSPAGEKDDGQVSISEIMETQGKSLFKPPSERQEKEIEMPQVEIVRQEEEPEEEKPAAAKQWEKETGGNLTLEEKVDEALALLKALESINEKILDTDRKILLRSKS